MQLSKSVQNVVDNHDFQGQSIVVSYQVFSPYCLVDSEGSMSGILPTLAIELGKMLNLTLKFEAPPVEKRKANRTWAGEIGDVGYGLVQTTVTGYAITADRSEFVDFTSTLSTSVGAYFIKHPGTGDISAQSYLSQYPLTSWLAVGLMYLLSWTSVIVLIYWQNRIAKTKTTKTATNPLVVGTESTILAVMNKPPQRRPNVLSQKIAYLSIFFMALMVLAYYKALLKAALSVRSYKLSVNSLEDILESALDFLVWKGTAAEGFFRLAAPGSLKRRIYESKIHDKPGPTKLAEVPEAVERAREGKAIYFGPAEDIIPLSIYPCEMTDVKPLR